MTDLALRPDADVLDESAEDAAVTKGERTRRRILELAIERFGSRGYKATSVSEIARAADLTQAAAYAYYDNKEALFQAAVDADASGLIDEVTANVTGTPVRNLIPSVILFAVIGLDAHPLTKRLLSGLEPDAIPRLVELPAMQRFGGLIADELRAAKERGEIRADLDPDLLAGGIESLVLGVLFSTVLSGGAAKQRHLDGVVEAFDLMLRSSDG
jgi:AcrR family transcriptional regulator